MPESSGSASCPLAPLLLPACRHWMHTKQGVWQRLGESEVPGLRDRHGMPLAMMAAWYTLQCTLWWAKPALRHRLCCSSQAEL